MNDCWNALIRKSHELRYEVIEDSKILGRHYGHCDPQRRIILINSKLPLKLKCITLAHELGHSMSKAPEGLEDEEEAWRIARQLIQPPLEEFEEEMRRSLWVYWSDHMEKKGVYQFNQSDFENYLEEKGLVSKDLITRIDESLKECKEE